MLVIENKFLKKIRKNKMHTNDGLPTTFANALGVECGLLLEDKSGTDWHLFNDRLELMKAFQQMAVICSFEDSLIAYHGFKLTKKQKANLKVIYKSTKPWMLGHVVGVLLNKLNGKMANKDFAESVRTIVEQLTETKDGEATERTKGVMIKLYEK